ncbi:MAG: anthranilate/aminodeoxychorismate synthase component II [Planctomycetota bacterium]|nr:MAG: anthranilate/aminodeoxychorismate synthase component II [Planctomycetota bacterium]
MILLIDNYDSFTFNLYQLLGVRCGTHDELRVVRNDALTADALVALRPDHVVLSPGPGHPRSSGLTLLATDLFPQTPLLGICLGHQALGLSQGAQVVRAPHPTHGQSVPIHHDETGLFRGVATPARAALYHSLVLAQDELPETLSVTARSAYGDTMAIQHRDRPHFGVQFHPESFMTDDGPTLIDNFLGTR